MKLFNLLFLLSLFFTQPTNAQVFWQDDFEATTPDLGGGTRTSSVGDAQSGTCCGSDRFVRTDMADDASCCGCADAVTGISNNFVWSGEDLDGTAPCSSSSQTITWTGIDISTRINLEFIGLFACRNGTSWEGADELKIEYKIDAGTFMEGICFSPDEPTELDLALDVDCNGTPDGADLSLALTEYSFSIPSTGTTMELRFTATVNGAGEEFAIDNFRLTEGVPLPVKLSDFKATLKDKNTLLKWKTESEENNDYFQIEHSMDGKTFRALGRVQGNGSTKRTFSYSYLHEYPDVGINYYRLKQVDYDGAFEYSEIKAVDFHSEKAISSVYPNPFNESLTIQFPTSGNNSSVGVRTIEVYDIYGKLVISTEVPADETNITLDLSTLNSGTYFLHTLEGQYLSTRIQRIIKI